MSPSRSILYPQITKSPPFTVEIADFNPCPGDTIPRRSLSATDGLLIQAEEGVATTYDVFRRASRKFGSLRAAGTRRVIRTHQEETKITDRTGKRVNKKWTYYELSGYTYLSFADLVLSERVKFAYTVQLGAASQSIVIVTAYDSLGEEGLRHSLNETGSTAIFLDPQILLSLKNVVEGTKSLRYIIYNTAPEVDTDIIRHLRSAYPHITIIDFDELRRQHHGLWQSKDTLQQLRPQLQGRYLRVPAHNSRGVPAVWELIKKGITGAVATKGLISRSLF
ncbi:long-chain fatty acid-CoA ligase [Aspergillus hancockii]|nr:long-chain fatty acid-CoA ligase [Aspergillus hancockii]